MKDTLKKLEELNTQRRVLVKQLEQEFNSALKQMFVDNPKLEQISMYVNNHEFNDGDATSFYIGWEDMTISVDGEEIQREWDSKTKAYTENPLLDNLIELFGQVQDIHEDIYGDAYENLTIDREEILNN
jgi:restriction endonuclease S subunit